MKIPTGPGLYTPIDLAPVPAIVTPPKTLDEMLRSKITIDDYINSSNYLDDDRRVKHANRMMESDIAELTAVLSAMMDERERLATIWGRIDALNELNRELFFATVQPTGHFIKDVLTTKIDAAVESKRELTLPRGTK